MKSLVAFLLVFLAVSVTLGGPARAEDQVSATSDVDTITDIVRASYEAINGAAGAQRQWDRVRALYTPNAIFVGTSIRAGKVHTIAVTLDEYLKRGAVRFATIGLFETEIGSQVERYGNVAEVRSVSVTRSAPGGPIEVRYVNYIHLFWDGVRWWIAGEVFDEERADNPIPAAWLKFSGNVAE